MSDSSRERRRHRRFQLRMPVTVLGAADQPTSRDLSEGGLFLETRVVRSVGVCLPVRLVHPETGEVIPAVCQVVRQVVDDSGEVIGLGLRFANTDESLGNRIRALIHDLVERSASKAADEAALDDEVTTEPALPPHDEPDLDLPDDRLEAPSDDEVAGEEEIEVAAVVEFGTDVAWELDTEATGEPVEVLVVEADVSTSGEHAPATVPIIWPDTRPEKIPGAVRDGLTPMQQRLLAFIDGNNTAEVAAQGAGLELEPALGELSDMARRAVIYIPPQAASDGDLEAWEKSTKSRSEPRQQARPLFPGRHEHAAEQERWRRARNLVTQGLAAERNDDFEDAVRFLEQALELAPPNAANIHARLAIVSMEHLADYDLAQRHAQACKDAEPHRPYGQRLLRRIKRLRARGKPAHPRKRRDRRPTRRNQRRRRTTRTRPQLRTLSTRRGVLLAGMAIAILVLLGYNAYRYLLPTFQAPESLDLSELATLVPAADARLKGRKLVITTTDDWDGLTNMEKTDRLQRLAEWARRNHNVREVLVADSTPALRARVVDREVKVYK